MSRSSPQVRSDRRSSTSVWSIFQNRDFRLLFASGSLGYTGRWMELTALSLLVLRETDSAWWVALVGVMRVTPMLVFGMLSGFIADRADRWLIMVLARSASVLAATVLLVLIITDWIQDWHILMGALALGLAMALEQPSRHSFLFDLVGPGNTTRAMSLEVLNITIGLLLGPLMAGLLIELTGYTGAYLFIASFYVLPLILNVSVESRIARTFPPSQPVWKTLTASIRYSVHNGAILGVLVTTILMNFVAFSSVQLFPVVARDHLHVGEGLTGLLISAIGMGTLIGSMMITAMGTIRFQGRLFFLGATVQLLGLLLFAISPWYILSFFMLLLFGLGLSGYSIMQATILLMSAAPERRGMAIGLMDLCVGAAPFGLLQVGAVATVLKAHEAIGINAVAGLVLLVPIIFLAPLVWRPIAPDIEETTGPDKPSPTTQTSTPDPVSKQVR